MGAIGTTPLVTPLVALLYRNRTTLDAALERLALRFGELELQSPAYPFEQTQYYDDEMGQALQRGFVTYRQLADPAALSTWKHAANALEQELSRTHNPEGFRRPINIDPGYLTGSKLVLASTKDFAHRIYLQDGIFAEITLYYRKGLWEHHRCTFPDFKAPTYHAFLAQARTLHLMKGPARAQ
jgi:hypothetical protein